MTTQQIQTILTTCFPLRVQLEFKTIFTLFTFEQHYSDTRKGKKNVRLLFLTVEWLKGNKGDCPPSILAQSVKCSHSLKKKKVLILAQWGSPARIQTTINDYVVST